MKYKLVAFDLDRTLIVERSIDFFAKIWDFEEKLNRLRQLLKDGKIKHYHIAKSFAKLFKGKKVEEVHELCKNIHLMKNAKELISEIKRKGMKTAIITNALSPIAEYFYEKLKVDYLVAPKVLYRDNIFTGKLDFKEYFDSKCPYDLTLHPVCKRLALRKLAENEGINVNECVAVGDGMSDICMLMEAGLKITINPKNKELKKIADFVIKDLKELSKIIL